MILVLIDLESGFGNLVKTPSNHIKLNPELTATNEPNEKAIRVSLPKSLIVL